MGAATKPKLCYPGLATAGCDFPQPLNGLAASVWRAGEARAIRVARRIESGTVWINESLAFSPHAPFAGLLEYTNGKTIALRRA